jgi:hypothetical protein
LSSATHLPGFVHMDAMSIIQRYRTASQRALLKNLELLLKLSPSTSRRAEDEADALTLEAENPPQTPEESTPIATEERSS